MALLFAATATRRTRESVIFHRRDPLGTDQAREPPATPAHQAFQHRQASPMNDRKQPYRPRHTGMRDGAAELVTLARVALPWEFLRIEKQGFHHRGLWLSQHPSKRILPQDRTSDTACNRTLGTVRLEDRVASASFSPPRSRIGKIPISTAGSNFDCVRQGFKNSNIARQSIKERLCAACSVQRAAGRPRHRRRGIDATGAGAGAGAGADAAPACERRALHVRTPSYPRMSICL
ncbi:hypothetical protein K431DRAFT_342325 [Polychaeton citri CBS 116435]|uniref:Uncharacterized protein n=1 Tax=Polychaeton citri CBS 116435 TaxID=1314669 RepID=A0A9P4QJK1_9PEZI|nr:hypothetical protein K431DRAFT_342325 [Polychaeton citri CBS 116435]